MDKDSYSPQVYDESISSIIKTKLNTTATKQQLTSEGTGGRSGEGGGEGGERGEGGEGGEGEKRGKKGKREEGEER